MAKRKEEFKGSTPTFTIVDEMAQVDEDQQLAASDGGIIREWLAGLVGFFLTAIRLEKEAVHALEFAKTWTLPATADDDEKLQREIRQATENQKQLLAHWSICAAVSRFHRRLTARRDVGDSAYDEVKRIGNALHNRFTEAQKRKAAEEDKRRREEAEFLAKQEQAAELARLEQEAIDAEAASPELSARETMFVDLYVGVNDYYNGKGQACAVAASYKDPAAAATRLLGSAKIQAAIKAKQQAAAIRRQTAAKAAQPLVVEYETSKPDIRKAPGASDRTTWGGEILDEAAALEAFRAGTHGIPADLFQINPAKLNEYGRSLHERLDLWPGVRHTKKTGVV